MNGERKFIPPEISRVEPLSAKLMALNRELAEKNRCLEQSEQTRKRMFANITHDLRAPLAVIRGAAERLVQTCDPQEKLRMARIVETRAAVLDKLISDLYVSMQVEQPEFALALLPLEAAPILEEYLIAMEASGRMDGRVGRLTIPEGCRARALIDTRYFLRVLDNLFENAIRHTAEGGTLELGLTEDADSLEIYLRDDGSGISPEDIPFVFERTFTAPAARTPGRVGGGLGLAIAKSIVEKHGGVIRCESARGAGTVFIIALPLIKT